MTSAFRLKQRAARFGSIFVSVLTITLYHRYLCLTAFAKGSYGWTYNAHQGFDPTTAFFVDKGPVLWLGVAGDVLFATATALLFTLAPYTVLLISFGVLAFFYASNIEHVKANLTSIDLDLLSFATDTTFIDAHLTSGIIVNAAIFFAIALVLLRLERLGHVARFSVLIGVALSTAAFAYIPNSFRISEPAWLQTHPLLPTLGQSRLETSDRNFDTAAFDRAQVIELGPERLNVLFVYLEGLSRFSLTKADMKTLGTLADQNISLERFVGHQLITSNGLYTTLTGDVPSFISSKHKWDDLADSAEVTAEALPVVLSEQGYHTAFLQSAPLAFMSKDTHLAELGFEELRGNQDWSSGDGVLRNGWGIDDRSLFRNVVNYIDDLDGTQPWFISVLTTGTHAPYNVPHDFLPQEISARYRALKYLDIAVAELMQKLEVRGLLANTVVIFTADESRESSSLPPLDNQILLSWLPFIAIHPSQATQSVNQVLPNKMTRDLVLKLATNTAVPDLQAFAAESEPVIFGNVFDGRIFWYEPQTGDFFACLKGAQLGCEYWRDVHDITRPTMGIRTGQAFFPNLKNAILDRE